MNFNIDSQKFQKYASQNDFVILDVRTPEEYSEIRIPNSKLLNFYDTSFPDEISNLDKNKKYLVYCRSGSRSFQTCLFMKQLGFIDVYNLQDGIINWDGEIESDY